MKRPLFLLVPLILLATSGTTASPMLGSPLTQEAGAAESPMVATPSPAKDPTPEIPLPEHPRPDFMRSQWINLNGTWSFRFDTLDAGIGENWQDQAPFDRQITVPFPWGSALSQVEDLGDIGWYRRTLEIPQGWDDRVFLVIGASDWHTTCWVDGREVGSHRGGYTPFEFDLTDHLIPGESHRLVIRVDDTPHPFKLEGKQGYGEAKGIWQTVYLEHRGQVALSKIHFTPDIKDEKVVVTAQLDGPAREELYLNLSFPNQEVKGIVTSPAVPGRAAEITFEVPVPAPRLWDLDDPYLYEVEVQLHNNETIHDHLSTYFGMREIGIVDLPGTEIPYMALNGKPVYLQMSLDQAYHPEGFYTYPSDEFMRDEILRSKKIGLNGNRIHIKAEIPRKLYWADKLGLLIMADVPNFWGEHTEEARREWEYAMRRMIERDFNHPSIFSWVLFNETWGLLTESGGERRYLPETQQWVRQMYHGAKNLDPTRLVEDNSANRNDHVVTDLNTWHAYLPGYAWEEYLKEVVEQTYPGSSWNFIGDNRQTRVPMLNSECGNVWGYTGSTGDVDWSWDYHIMLNEFRKHPEISGWLYTEHHDVINEWNGYYRYDRSEKYPGLSSFIPDMELEQLHSEVYLSTGSDLCRPVKPEQKVIVPLHLSVMTDRVPPGEMILDYELSGHDHTGRFRHLFLSSRSLPSAPYFNGPLDSLSFTAPSIPGLYHLSLRIRDENAQIYHLNFTSFLVEEKADPAVPFPLREDAGTESRSFSFDPAGFTEAEWSLKQWNVLEGLKVNGAGSGYFYYEVELPSGIDLDRVKNVALVFEASAKKLHGKDRPESSEMEGDYMRGRGTFDPGRNPNAYPMTDTRRDPSMVRVRVNGRVVETFYLEDDPADHRGVLSWFSQPRDRKLREAGSYGYLCKAGIPVELLREIPGEPVKIRFEVDEGLPGGLAVYGRRFGRYPLDPTLLFEFK